MMIGVYIFGPEEIVLAYAGHKFTFDETEFLELGEPVLESAGVEDRRGFFHHHFNAERLPLILEMIKQEGFEGIVEAAERLPRGWRYEMGL